MPLVGVVARRSGLTSVGVIVLAAMLLPAEASAQGAADTTFTCRSSAARLSINILPPPLEPLTGNPNANPCADDFAGVNELKIPNAAPLITTTTASARTDVLCRADDPDPDVDPDDNDACDAGFRSFEQQVVSRADLEDLNVGLPGLTLGLDAANVRARASCTDAGVATLESSSSLASLSVNGMPITIPPDGEPTSLDLGAIKIFINERIGAEGPLADGAATGSLTRRALRIAVPGTGDIVVGEASVGISGDACPEGRIVIKNQTAPDEQANTSQFNFATLGLTPAAFTLADDGQQVFEDVPPGLYPIVEAAPPPPYRVGLVECADPSGGTVVSVDLRAVLINLEAGETVTCAFVNITGDGQIVCPPNTLPFNDTGTCVISDVKCPGGTQFDPRSSTCEPSTGGTIVPKDQVPGIRRSPCRAAKFGMGFAIIGTNGRDRLTGSNRADAIFAFGGKDLVSGGRGNDCVDGGRARDELDGSNGNDLLLGRGGRDVLSGALGGDTLRGGASGDALAGARGRDRLFGERGNDKMQGGFGRDLIVGGAGKDFISTGQGKDRVLGGPGNDIINSAIVGPAARINCGRGRKDRVRINMNEVKRIKNCEFVDVLTRRKSRPRR